MKQTKNQTKHTKKSIWNPIFTTNLQSKIIPMIAIQIRNTYPLIKPLVSALENFVEDFEIPKLNHSTFVSINILWGKEERNGGMKENREDTVRKQNSKDLNSEGLKPLQNWNTEGFLLKNWNSDLVLSRYCDDEIKGNELNLKPWNKRWGRQKVETVKHKGFPLNTLTTKYYNGWG